MTDPALTVRTARLRLRTYRPSDAEALLPIYAREDVSRFLLCDPWTAEVARTEIGKRIPRTGLGGESKALALVIETDDDHEDFAGSTVIGDIAIWLDSADETKAEIGWVLNPAAGGHGFASEAALAVLNHAFDDAQLRRVVAQMDARNTASAKLAERIGMTREAHLRSDWWSKGEWTDTLVFGMLASDRKRA